jgi:HEAT repeat protein
MNCKIYFLFCTSLVLFLFGCVSKEQVSKDVNALYSNDPRIRAKAFDKLISYGSASLNALEEALKSQNAEVRRLAVRALGRINNAKSLPALTKMLKDPATKVRSEAVKALVSYKQAAVPELLKVMNSPETTLGPKLLVIEALGQIKSSLALKPLIRNLTYDSALVQRASIAALAKLQPESIKPLINVLDSKDPELRVNAAAALTKIGKPAIEDLMDKLSDTDRNRQLQIVTILGKLSPPQALSPLMNKLRSPYPEVRFAAAEAVARYGNKAVASLIDGIEDSGSEDEVREARIFALVLIKENSPQKQQMIINLTNDSDPYIRMIIVKGLESLKNKAAEKILLQMLSDKNWRVRKAAALALLANGWKPTRRHDFVRLHFAMTNWKQLVNCGEDALPVLKLAAKDDQDWVRCSAKNTLKQINRRQSKRIYTLADDNAPAPTLVQVNEMLQDSNWQIRQKAVNILKKKNIDQAGELLTRVALNDQEPFVRKEAVKALADFKKSFPEQTLIKATHDPNRLVRKAAIISLDKVSGKKLPPQIIDMLKDPDPLVRMTAGKILKKRNYHSKSPEIEAYYYCATGQYNKLSKIQAKALPAISFVLSNTPESSIKIKILDSAARIKDAASIAMIYNVFKDTPDILAKVHAGKLLREKDPDAVNKFIIVLQSDKPVNRKLAAEMLGKMEYTK